MSLTFSLQWQNQSHILVYFTRWNIWLLSRYFELFMAWMHYINSKCACCQMHACERDILIYFTVHLTVIVNIRSWQSLKCHSQNGICHGGHQIFRIWVEMAWDYKQTTSRKQLIKGCMRRWIQIEYQGTIQCMFTHTSTHTNNV